VFGCLDLVTEDGLALGWAWYPARPALRLEIELLVDGQAAGTTLAGLFREDVARAGIGDGFYGFAWPLPYDVLALPRDVVISARDKVTGHTLAEPRVYRQKIVVDALRKLAVLESDVRLLRGTIAALEVQRGQEERASAALFRTVGDFFAALADAGPAAPPRLLNSAMTDMFANFPPLGFAACAAAEVSVFIEARGSVAAVFAILQAVAAGLGDRAAEIFLLDGGAGEAAALLPLRVRHLGYARLEGRPAVAMRNDAMRLASGGIVIFLAAGVRPEGVFVPACMAGFGAAEVAALAGRVSGPDGALVEAGVLFRDGAAVACVEDRPAGAVAGVGAEIFAVRKNFWTELGGFDEGFVTLGAALAEFCLRAQAAGGTVVYAPQFAAVADGQAGASSNADYAGDAARLAEVIGELSSRNETRSAVL
jgi:hypothetical protein